MYITPHVLSLITMTQCALGVACVIIAFAYDLPVLATSGVMFLGCSISTLSTVFVVEERTFGVFFNTSWFVGLYLCYLGVPYNLFGEMIIIIDINIILIFIINACASMDPIPIFNMAAVPAA